MDHTAQGYLKRRTTEELDNALHYYLEQNDLSNYENVIRMIMDELYQREKDLPGEISPELNKHWEIFKERYYSRMIFED